MMLICFWRFGIRLQWATHTHRHTLTDSQNEKLLFFPSQKHFLWPRCKGQRWQQGNFYLLISHNRHMTKWSALRRSTARRCHFHNWACWATAKGINSPHKQKAEYRCWFHECDFLISQDAALKVWKPEHAADWQTQALANYVWHCAESESDCLHRRGLMFFPRPESKHWLSATQVETTCWSN